MEFNHPFTYQRSLTRLIDEYNKHQKLVIGFDFDNTIFDVHSAGGDYSCVINLLREAKKQGFILCLYTAETREDWLEWKVKYCEHFGISPDYVNESPLLPGTTKPFFNLLLDDRAGLQEAYNLLNDLIAYANSPLNITRKKSDND